MTLSPRSQLVQSTVCAGCLKDFHTTYRVQQHLRYRPNGCWDRLSGARMPDTPASIDLPAHLKHMKRLPAVRRHLGPLRPTSQYSTTTNSLEMSYHGDSSPWAR